MDRGSSNIVKIVAQARQDLDELKEMQFFGADALSANHWQATVSNSQATYRLTLIPDEVGTVLPLKPELEWTFTGTYGAAMEGAVIYQRYTSDGTFQWNVYFYNSGDISSTTVHLNWIGDATVKWEAV